MEFQFFDLESISELGLAPELLQPEDLLLGVPDVPEVQDVHTTNIEVERAQENFDSFFTNKDENVKDLDSALTYANDVAPFVDLFSFMDMGEVTEVATVPTTTTTILDDAMEECGIGSPASSNGEFSPLPPTIHIEEAKPLATDIEKTQELINDVESYLKSVDGTPTSLNDDIQTTFQDIMEEDNQPITVEGNPSLMDEIDKVFHHSETFEVPVMEYLATQEVTPTSTQSSPTALLEALANGKVSVNDSGMTLTEEDLSRAYTTTMVTEDGENMVIIIAPPSPAAPTSPSNSFVSATPSPGPSLISLTDYDSSYDTDPDYSPGSKSRTTGTSRNNGSVYQIREKTSDEPPRRKYQRRKPPQPPVGPYPTDKKERKKAQNRTAAFRYREKKKQEQEMADGEVETLVTKNSSLKAKLNDVENELRILKKLMTEAGLGKYANVVKL